MMILTKKKFEEMVAKRLEEQHERIFHERNMEDMRRSMYEMTDRLHQRIDILEAKINQHIYPANPAPEADCERVR